MECCGPIEVGAGIAEGLPVIRLLGLVFEQNDCFGLVLFLY